MVFQELEQFMQYLGKYPCDVCANWHIFAAYQRPYCVKIWSESHCNLLRYCEKGQNPRDGDHCRRRWHLADNGRYPHLSLNLLPGYKSRNIKANITGHSFWVNSICHGSLSLLVRVLICIFISVVGYIMMGRESYINLPMPHSYFWSDIWVYIPYMIIMATTRYVSYTSWLGKCDRILFFQLLDIKCIY